jgi:DNA repair exonuclease SbcCD ATPase subunit
MYIKRVQIKNIRSFTDLEWRIDPDRAAGWHVIIGDNGTGKSAFVCST